MPQGPARPELKRRRAAIACESCRTLKSKCDGKQPSCGRCTGYGYSCRYTGRLNRHHADNEHPSRLSLGAAHEAQVLGKAVRAYDELVRDFRANLQKVDRKVLDLSLFSIRQSLPEGCLHSDQSIEHSSTDQTPAEHSAPPERYLGEASDVRFFNFMRQALGEAFSTECRHASIASYDQGDMYRQVASDRGHPVLPNKGIADMYLEIYFSTIHIAYPFVNKHQFSQNYNEFWELESTENMPASWLSLLLTMFSIGANYMSFCDPESAEKRLHARYFQQAVLISRQNESDRSLDNLRALLAQCFYLLATCQTDRCWTALGLIVRMAQSIGLHVEDPVDTSTDRTSVIRHEMRRRTWYSIYVLDRLLALQLGRPPAIHEGDFNVRLPSRQDDEYLFRDNAETSKSAANEHLIGDYFIHVIRFSHIVGYVMRKLYNTPRLDPGAEVLSTIESLDQQLLQWKLNLPRRLRFDICHTFEKSETFRRQRNMLAVKFHHIRALIHRPLLSPSWLHGSNPDATTFLQHECHRISRLKGMCILEAQKMAQLLHNVDDEKSLVQRFPWWQMISCLICASSILLVASIFCGQDQMAAEMDWAALDEDADACLRVFEALSANSDAAGLARDMMKGLKETRMSRDLPNFPSHTDMQSEHHTTDVPTDALAIGPLDINAHGLIDVRHPGQGPTLGQFPCEISEPIMWSSQFVHAAYNPFLGGTSSIFEDGTIFRGSHRCDFAG